MLAQLAQKIDNAHQDMYVLVPSGPPYTFETQRIWLVDVPTPTSTPNRRVNLVRVQFADGSTDTASANIHPTNPCLSYLTTLTAPAPLVKVYGPPTFYGRYEDLVQIYSASTTLFPFLFVLDTIKSDTDYNIYHVSDFTLLLVGLINTQDSLQVSSLNIVAQYISQMLRNVDIKVNNIREYARISFEQNTFEVYIQAFDCETYLMQKYL